MTKIGDMPPLTAALTCLQAHHTSSFSAATSRQHTSRGIWIPPAYPGYSQPTLTGTPACGVMKPAREKEVAFITDT